MAAFADRTTDQGYQQFNDYISKTKGRSYDDAYGFQGNDDAAYANYVSGMGGAVAGRGRSDFDNFKQFSGGSGGAQPAAPAPGAAPAAAPAAAGASSPAMQGLQSVVDQQGPTPGWADDPALAQTAGELGTSVPSQAMGVLSAMTKRGIY